METLYTNFRRTESVGPQTLRIRDGRIVSLDPGLDPAGIDLGGKWMLPAFVDNHCHILPTGLDLQKLHLGPCDTHESVLDAVRARLDQIPDNGWLLAVHYDQTRYDGGRHLSLTDLDKISTTVPILLRHVNGHASVANSAALALAKVAEDEPNPSGGAFERDANGRITGVLLEAAHERVTQAVPNPTLEEMVQAILDAGRSMATFGIGTAADMMTGRYDLLQELQAYRLASERGCPVRLRLYVQWSSVFGPRAAKTEAIAEQTGQMQPERCRIAGIKIFADGAIGSGTAAIYGRYSGAPASGSSFPTRKPPEGARSSLRSPYPGLQSGDPAEVSGQLIYSPDKLKQMVLTAHDVGHQVSIHSIGDYSTDLVLDAFEATGEPSRHRIEHAMILSDAQIERMAKLNPYCCMQPEFLKRFGHSYQRQLGPERAARLKRTRSVKDAGIRLSFSSDRPIVAGDPLDGITTASSRPPGFDPAEAVTREEALLAYTQDGAIAMGDERLGRLDVGALADFTLWESNPISSPDAKVIQEPA